MAFIPRKSEIAEMVGVLENDSFETSSEMARAALKTAWASICERELFGVAIKDGSLPLLMFGVASSERDAAQKVKDFSAHTRNCQAQVFKLRPLSRVTAKAEAEAQLSWDFRTHKCAACGHHEWEHGRVAAWGGKTRPVKAGEPKCSVKCGCAGFVKPEMPKRASGD